MGHWQDAQEEELNWWGTCTNTLGEEIKQLVYARLMGISFYHDGSTPYNIELNGKHILDIGGGPCSLLLKTKNGKGMLADPCDYPAWVEERYKLAGIKYNKLKGEDIKLKKVFDEVWIYNVLQHVDSVEKIIQNAKQALKSNGLIRIFEWIDHPTNHAHPISLSKAILDENLGGNGEVTYLDEQGCVGKAYYGVFEV